MGTEERKQLFIKKEARLTLSVIEEETGMITGRY